MYGYVWLYVYGYLCLYVCTYVCIQKHYDGEEVNRFALVQKSSKYECFERGKSVCHTFQQNITLLYFLLHVLATISMSILRIPVNI